MLEFQFGTNVLYVPLNEAGVLQSILDRDGSAGTAALRRSIGAATGVASPPPIQLGPNDIAALRDVICGDLFIGFPALSILQGAICREHPDYVFRDS